MSPLSPTFEKILREGGQRYSNCSVLQCSHAKRARQNDVANQLEDVVLSDAGSLDHCGWQVRRIWFPGTGDRNWHTAHVMTLLRAVFATMPLGLGLFLLIAPLYLAIFLSIAGKPDFAVLLLLLWLPFGALATFAIMCSALTY